MHKFQNMKVICLFSMEERATELFNITGAAFVQGANNNIESSILQKIHILAQKFSL